MASNWTNDASGRANSSEVFVAICSEVERLIRGDAYRLIAGQADATAGLIVAQLAHKHDFGPVAAVHREGWAAATEALRAEGERANRTGELTHWVACVAAADILDAMAA